MMPSPGMKNNIFQIFKAATLKNFIFLDAEFDCHVLSVDKDAAQFSINYANKTTGIGVRYEPLDNVVFIYLVKLVDGAFPAYSVKNWYNIDSLIYRMSPVDKIEQEKYGFSFSNSQEDFDTILSLYARALKKYGKNILRGDFAIFES